MKILFVCLGNICRSPMAEFILKDLLKKKNIRHIEVSSAATSAYEIGNEVYPPAKKILEKHGISSAGKTARQIQISDYNTYDYLIGMDEKNRSDMIRFFNGDPEHKIRLLLEYTEHPKDILDPYFTKDFETAMDDILRGCNSLLNEILE